MSTDTKWIIGTIVPAILVMAGLLSAQISGVDASLNTRIDGMNDRLERLETDVRSMGDRLRAVEATFLEVGQRLETLERALLPAAVSGN